MVVLLINSPSKDISELLFSPKETGKPKVLFSGSSNATKSNANNTPVSPYFVGPIQISESGVNHGLGVIASRDIEAGECLFVTQPAVSVDVLSVFKDWKAQFSNGDTNDTVSHNTDSRKATSPHTLLEKVSEDALVLSMRQKLQSEHEEDQATVRSFLLQLTEGEDSEEARQAILPETQEARMAALVGESRSIRGADNFSQAASTFSDLTDDQLREIIHRNAFGPDFTLYESVEHQWQEQLLSQNDNNTVHSPSRLLGLYPLAAMLNHSCVPNALRVFAAGDWMIVHASSNIAKGSEIVWSYLPPILSYPQRRQQLQERHGFVCRCARCLKEEEAEASAQGVFLVPESLRAFEKVAGLSALQSPESRKRFTKNLMDWEKGIFDATTSPLPKSNEIKRYWKIGNANLFINYLNAVLMDISSPHQNYTPEEVEKARANALLAAMDLHFCFVTCHYASTEHLSVMHLCYELVAIMHSKGSDPTKTLPKVKFWTEQLKRAHLIRYGSLGDDITRVRMIMKHTQLILRNKNGRDQVAYDFI